MRRGIYVVGDPYHFFDTKDGILRLEKMIAIQKVVFIKEVGEVKIKDNFGTEYWLDSGWFGIIPVPYLKIDSLYSIKDVREIKGMRLTQFNRTFYPEFDGEKFKFGRLECKIF